MIDLLLKKPDFLLYDDNHTEEPLNLFVVKSYSEGEVEDFSGVIFNKDTKPRFFTGIKNVDEILFQIEKKYYTFKLSGTEITLTGIVRSPNLRGQCHLKKMVD